LYVIYRDPEGWLSTLPAIGTSLLGILAGKLIRSARPAKEVRTRLLAAGVAGIALGYLWNIWFPINKNMWTSSYVLLSAGIATILLGLCYSIYDVSQRQKTSRVVRSLSWPCIVFGSNAITAYVMSTVWEKAFGLIHIHDGAHTISPLMWLNKYGFQHWGSTANSSLAFAIFYVALCFLPVWVLWRRGIFLRV
jgi:predicted acyltransferase